MRARKCENTFYSFGGRRGLATDMDGVTRAWINLIAGIMLHLSGVMCRLTTLERHIQVCATDDDGENPNILLGFISGAINEMGKTFPDDICHVMPEYGKMWSRLSTTRFLLVIGDKPTVPVHSSLSLANTARTT